MKIGLVFPYNITLGGGVKEIVLALREGLIARGHDVHIITPQPNGQKGYTEDGTIFVGGARPFRGFATTTNFSASIDLEKLTEMLNKEKFDVLHFHEPWTPMLSRQILSRSDAIHIGTFHATLSGRMMTRTFEKVITPYTKSLLKYLDVLTAVSPAASKYVKTLTDQRVHIVANGIDLQKFSPKTETSLNPKEAKTIFYVGRLEKRKGLKYLLDAFALLHDVEPHYKLVIAGDGPDRVKLETYVADNDIPNVTFLGYIDDSVKQKYLQEASVFCSPALYGESFGIVLLEAMASGCVVVAGNNTGYESVMSGRGQISLVNPKDTTEFARRLSLLATDQVLRDAWCDWAKEEVKQYDYERIVGEYLALYEASYAKRHA